MHSRISSFALLTCLLAGTSLGAWACTLNAGTTGTDTQPAEDSSASKSKKPTDADSGAPLSPTTSTMEAGADAMPAFDESKLYEGTWAYQAASALVLVCPGQPANVVDLSKAGKDGSNGTFDLSLRGGKIHEVDGLGCEYDFAVVDHAAVTQSPATCNKLPDGRGGYLLITTDTTHKTTRDGRTLNVAAHAKVGSNQECDLYVEGHALKTSGGATGAPAPGGGTSGAPGTSGSGAPPGMPPGGPAISERDRYVAKWTYERGSALVVACPGQPASTVDLSLADQGKAGAFVFSALGDSQLHELDGAGCEYDLSILDGAAVVTHTQTCNKFRDAKGNATLLTTVTSRKTSWDATNMVISGHAKLGQNQECDLFVEGTAKSSR